MQQHLGSVDVVVQVANVNSKCRILEECIDCRVLIQFESREPQYYHVIIPRNSTGCTCVLGDRTVEVEEIARFLENGVWLHLVGASHLHYPIGRSIKDARRDPEGFASCQIHLIPQRIEILHSGT